MFLNKTQIIARLTHTPEITMTRSGIKKARLTLANNESWRDQQGNKVEKSYYYEAVFWRGVAEVIEKYAIKGQEVYIEGKMVTDKYEGRDGTTKYKTYIMGEVFQLGQKPANAADRPTAAQKAANDFGDTANATPAADAPGYEDFGTPPDDEIRVENIPF